MESRKFDLEERLIDFCVLALAAIEDLPNTKAGKYFEDQIMRSCSSPALNYGEAQAAESKKDFIHKMKIILEELRETSISFKIVERKNLLNTVSSKRALTEAKELVAIFTKSVDTAEKNNR